MNTSKALEILSSIKNGTFGVVEYQTELPVNKEAKKAGVKIYCRTKKMVRFGAAYENLVKEVVTSEAKPRTNNYSWILKNKVAHNSNTEKDYIRVSNINRKTISKQYIIEGDTMSCKSSSLSGCESFLQPSFFKNSSYSKPIVQNISVSNILSINGLS